MPKILNLNSYHYRRGGSDVVYLEHAALMEELGWSSGYFSMRHPKNLPTPWDRHFVDELEFGQSYGIGQKVLMATKVIYSLEARRKLAALLDEFTPDLAHVHCIYHHLSPAVLPLLRERGVPVVLTAHDLKLACPAYKMLNQGGVCERCKSGSVINVVRHRCVQGSLAASVVVAAESGLHRRLNTYRRSLNRVVTPSRFYQKKLMEWGWPEQQLTYIPNYVDVRRFQPDYSPGDYVLYFGRMAPEKGVRTLLYASAKSGVAVKLAGTGPLLEELQALASNLAAPAEFVGFRAGDDLHNLIRGSRAVVLPSEWYENAPMSVLESFALGKPVIGADIGGIPEMISPGETGWVYSSGDVDQLSCLLSEVERMPPSKLGVIGRAARADVELRFNRQAYVNSMLSLYAELGVNV